MEKPSLSSTKNAASKFCNWTVEKFRKINHGKVRDYAFLPALGFVLALTVNLPVGTFIIGAGTHLLFSRWMNRGGEAS